MCVTDGKASEVKSSFDEWAVLNEHTANSSVNDSGYDVTSFTSHQRPISVMSIVLTSYHVTSAVRLLLGVLPWL